MGEIFFFYKIKDGLGGFQMDLSMNGLGGPLGAANNAMAAGNMLPISGGNNSTIDNRPPPPPHTSLLHMSGNK